MSNVRTRLEVVSARTLDAVCHTFIQQRPLKSVFCLRASVCVCTFASVFTVAFDTFASACVHTSAFGCMQLIERLHTFRRGWISVSGRVFCSRTFGMYYVTIVDHAQEVGMQYPLVPL